MSTGPKIVLAMTGASGAAYAVRLLDVLLASGCDVHLSISPAGEPRVHKVWCAVDCGRAVNPDIVAAQMEGGIGYGLGAGLYGAITLDEGGSVRQSNFHDYRSLRIGEAPEIEVAMPARSVQRGRSPPSTPPTSIVICTVPKSTSARLSRFLRKRCKRWFVIPGLEMCVN